jgi:hypothetical protein
MISSKRKLASVAVWLFVFGISLGQANSTEAKQRVAIRFQKSPSGPGTWSGTGMANDGTAVTVGSVLTATRDTGRITHVVDFKFRFTPAETSQTVVVDLVGIINNVTGRVVLNGAVVSSAHPAVPVGTRAHLSGQVTDNPTPFTVIGTIYMTIP